MSSAIFYPHFIILIFPSAFGVIRILSSAMFLPHFAIRNLSSAVCPHFSIRIQCHLQFSFRVLPSTICLLQFVLISPSAFSVICNFPSACLHPHSVSFLFCHPHYSVPIFLSPFCHLQFTVRIFRPHFDILNLVCVLQRPFEFSCLHNDSMTNYR